MWAVSGKSSGERRLRTRVTLFFSIATLATSLALAVVTYAVARNYLIDQRTSVAKTQSFSNAYALRAEMAAPNPTQLGEFIGQLPENGGFSILITPENTYFSDVRFPESVLPSALVTNVKAGNYGLQRFLESEGAEVDIQIVTNWVLYNIWEHTWDTRQRMLLRTDDKANKGLAGVHAQQKLATLWLADKALRVAFKSIAGILGLHDYYMPDMDEVAEEARELYNNHLRGGEGHMEVGKLVMNVKHKKATMTLSVKPFGCMPSSGVSDGVQSYVTERWPSAIFLPIETSGDGAVNVYSRILMMLFRARTAASAEFAQTCQQYGVTPEEVRQFVYKNRRFASPFFWPRHRVATTASDLVHEVAPYMKDPLASVKQIGQRVLRFFSRAAAGSQQTADRPTSVPAT